jgi:methanogenic corrinoid protein MtbC1
VGKKGVGKEIQNMSNNLIDAMSTMREEEALAIARALLDDGEDPLKILNDCSQAMDIVGKRFEEETYFLPELMLAGDMLKQISEMVKPKLHGEMTSGKRGKVLMGTVQGDIHDIGKDIVTFLLEVNGFEVRDIGIDVSPGTFVEEIKAFQPQVVGMSGLLTLAYDAMKRTVQAIEGAGLWGTVKIMIGGGQVSEKVRAHAGADAFGKDAMEAVALVKQWIGAG